ncbi:DUF2961 domain-containing protein [Sphingopyxis sp. XHP0097]|uniref:DUF2961 domain-containing protein n=1 Tax=Sphingopyxis jiangsuensis TaxID=2871171 RepID=A0ABS7MHA0_9SPHN|nr:MULTISPECIES: DUF2961 domain-containing protein [Sphingopyxis]MBY4638407.1 DUF2961 domain-containing protein [Sphingopyxis jiangsuensis]
MNPAIRRGLAAWLLVPSLAAPIPSPAKSGTENQLVPSTGDQRLAEIELLPYFYPAGTQSLQFSSYDPTGGNRDGEYRKSFVKYVDENGEDVIFDAYGPGALQRQQFNIWSAFAGHAFVLKPGAASSRLRYYFDDEENPRIDVSVAEMFQGKSGRFGGPLSFTGNWADADIGLPIPTPDDGPLFGVQYRSLPFARRLKITFIPSDEYRANLGIDSSSWYQFTYLLYPVGTTVASWSPERGVTGRIERQWLQLGEEPKAPKNSAIAEREVAIEPGKATTIFEHSGAAAIASLKLKLAPYDRDTFFKTRIRMSWDGNRPAVDMPLASFFGGGGADFATGASVPSRTMRNLLFGFDGENGTFYSYWPMPFWRSAKIEIVNDSGQPIVITASGSIYESNQVKYVEGEAGYFSARLTRDRDEGDGLYARAFREQGLGHVVGRTLYSEGYAMDGDEFTYIDGNRSPQIHGDGTEDDHNQGWAGAAYRQPLWGGVVNGYQGAYRLHISDPYVFEDEIRTNYEYSKLFRSSNGAVETVFYYYKAGLSPRGIQQTDMVDVGLEASERAHDYRIEGQTWTGQVRSSYDGYEKNVAANTFLDEGRAFNGASEFTVAVHPANVGVKLRRLISRLGNGVQTAEVHVDGVQVERPWHVVQSAAATADQAWVDTEFEIPAALTKGKNRLRIKVKYRGSAKGEINEFRYWILSHVPPRTF